MISLHNISKNFDDIRALDSVTAQIREGSIFGIIGSNGAGKSTLLRVLSGIYRQDSGKVEVDGEPVFENTRIKQKIFYISDDQHYFPNATMRDMKDYYQKIYPAFDSERFEGYTSLFRLSPDRKLNTFSKGMQKQAFIIFALSCRPKYLLCDETFDGLDPVMRQAVKKIFAGEVASGGMTPIIASHNLRELEDICDHVGLLHKGGIVFEREMNELVEDVHKIQCVFREDDSDPLQAFDVITKEKRGSLHTIVVRGKKEGVMSALNARTPLFAEILPLTLEEIFICEMEGLGYEIENIIL